MNNTVALPSISGIISGFLFYFEQKSIILLLHTSCAIFESGEQCRKWLYTLIHVKFILRLPCGALLLTQISLDTASHKPSVLKTKKLSVSSFHLTNPEGKSRFAQQKKMWEDGIKRTY